MNIETKNYRPKTVESLEDKRQRLAVETFVQGITGGEVSDYSAATLIHAISTQPNGKAAAILKQRGLIDSAGLPTDMGVRLLNDYPNAKEALNEMTKPATPADKDDAEFYATCRQIATGKKS